MKKFFLFFSLISLSYIGIHLYISNFFARAGFLKNNTNKFFLIIAFLSIFSFFLRRKFNSDFFEILYFLSFLWMGYVLIWSFFIFVGCFLSYFVEFKKIFIGVNILTFLVSLISIYNALKLPSINYLNYSSDRVAKDYKIAFISDIHIDFGFKNRLFSKIIDRISAEKPELLIIGGDLLDPGFRIDENIYKIRDLKIPIIFVLGNHEYYFGIDKTVEIAKELNIKLIRDESFNYGDLNLIGVSDIRTEGLDFDYIKRIISKYYENKKLNIIISHEPLFFKELASNFDFLMLCGHTHCGQIFPFHIFIKLIYKYFCGSYIENKSFLYVSSGSGSWGPVMRFLAGSEIVFLNIRKDGKNNS